MNLPDGHYFSPGGGLFYVRDNVAYWEDGCVFPLDRGDGSCLAILYMDMDSGEDYSQWSDEKREAVAAEKAEQRRSWTEERAVEETKLQALRDSAREKLTPQEYDAVVVEGRDW
jgi:hypothetical protein